MAPGDVAIGARVLGASALVGVWAFVDGEPLEARVADPPSARVVLSSVRRLAVGPHEVHIQTRDDRGQVGSYSWGFTVGQRQPLPTATSAADGAMPTYVAPALPPRPTPTLPALVRPGRDPYGRPPP